jgi:DNA repair protein SbcD/Mre11
MGKFRLLHTSDWHLGRALHERPRDYEQQVFLDWLLDTLEDEQIDCLLVAGDVFDSPGPGVQSQQLFYSFLAAAKERRPVLDVVIIAGDHDSDARLDATRPLFAASGVHVLGGLVRSPEGSPNVDPCLITLRRSSGAPAAYLAAVPFLRPRGISSPCSGEDTDRRLVESIGSIYRRLCGEIIRRAGSEHPSIAAGHLFLAGCHRSDASERKIQNGYLAALPVDLFCPALSYVGLGHLHLAQAVSDNIYYAGSPLPLAFAETDYRHAVLVAEFDGPRLVEVRAIPVPRPVEILRIPSDGPQPLEQVLESISQLEGLEGRDPSSPARPYLEVRVQLDAPRPTLREEITQALNDKWACLLKMTLDPPHPADIYDLASPSRSLDELNQEEIFRHCYRRKYSSALSILDEPDDQLMQAFRLLWEEQETGQAR